MRQMRCTSSTILLRFLLLRCVPWYLVTLTARMSAADDIFIAPLFTRYSILHRQPLTLPSGQVLIPWPGVLWRNPCIVYWLRIDFKE